MPADRLHRRTFITAGLVACGGMALGPMASVWAQSTVPQEVSGELGSAQLAGSSRMRFFGLGIYDARLWVAPGFRAATYAQHGLALELTYLRSLSGNAIAERSVKEMRRSGELSTDTERRWLAAMQEAFPDVQEGNRITGLHLPSMGAKFWFNGQLRSTIADVEFSRRFFGIWLSEATSEPALRAELLARAAP
jgi:hypothetical protein